MTAFRNILVTTDFSDNSRPAFAHAIELAKRYEAKMTAVHVSPTEGFVTYGFRTIPVPPSINQQIVETVETGFAKLRDDFAAELTFETRHLRSGCPWQAITDLAAEEKFDLIVIATHGITGVQRMLLGSTAENVVRHAGCPVLTVRSN